MVTWPSLKVTFTYGPGKAKLLVPPFLSKAGGYRTAREEEGTEYETTTISGPYLRYGMVTVLASALLHRHQFPRCYRNRPNAA